MCVGVWYKDKSVGLGEYDEVVGIECGDSVGCGYGCGFDEIVKLVGI